ncbi:MAG: ATP-binding cassette domain-containing protein [Terriglobia bacterium]
MQTLHAQESILRAVNLKKSFGAVEVLKGVSLEIHKGEIVALMGDNGAGKSTLVKMLAGVFQPDEGDLFFEDRKVNWKAPNQSRKAGIEIVYQDLGLVPMMDVGRNFFLGKELARGPFGFLDLKRMYSEASRGLSQLGITLSDPEVPVCELSGGQQKAVAIGRSLYFGVKVLILDEPTAALSLKETQIVLRVIKNLKEKLVSVIFITHNVGHACQVADRFIVLAAGKKQFDIRQGEVSPDGLTRMVIEGQEAIA